MSRGGGSEMGLRGFPFGGVVGLVGRRKLFAIPYHGLPILGSAHFTA